MIHHCTRKGRLPATCHTFVVWGGSCRFVELGWEMFEYLQSISAEPWKPISRATLVAWVVFNSAFLVYAFSQHGGFLFIDSANLVVHEGGHNLFGWFGPTLGL
jgi:hypothetical protein